MALLDIHIVGFADPAVFPFGTFELLCGFLKPYSMLVTLFGIVTEVKLMQLMKALFPMLVTPSLITTEVMEER